MLRLALYLDRLASSLWLKRSQSHPSGFRGPNKVDILNDITQLAAKWYSWLSMRATKSGGLGSISPVG